MNVISKYSSQRWWNFLWHAGHKSTDHSTLVINPCRTKKTWCSCNFFSLPQISQCGFLSMRIRFTSLLPLRRWRLRVSLEIFLRLCLFCFMVYLHNAGQSDEWNIFFLHFADFSSNFSQFLINGFAINLHHTLTPFS